MAALLLIANGLARFASPPTVDLIWTGFYPQQQSGAFDYAFARPHAALLFSRRPSEPAELIMRVSSPQPLPPRRLRIRYDDQSLTTAPVGNAPLTVRLVLPTARSGMPAGLIVELDVDSARAPGDSRELGLLFRDIGVRTYPSSGGSPLPAGASAAFVGAVLLLAAVAGARPRVWRPIWRWRMREAGMWLRRSALSYPALIAGVFLSYVGLLGYYSIANHAAYRTSTYDLGLFDQWLWLISRGYPPYSTGNSLHVLSDHAALLLYPLAALYWIASDVRLLLLAQTVAIAAGIIPIYLIAQAHGRPALGVFVGLAYLLHPATHNMNLFDFHTDAFGATALLFALWAIDRRRWVALVVASLVVIAAKENFAITIAWLGIWLLLQRHWRVGAVLVVLGVGWFVLATRVIMPMFNGYATMVQFGRFGQYGNSLPEIARTMLSKPQLVFGDLLQPDRRTYLLALLLPFAFLPLLNPKYLALSAPAIAINLLASFDPQRTLMYHYSALPVALLAVATLYSLLGIVQRRSRPDLAGAVCIVGVAICCVVGLASNFSRLANYVQYGSEDRQRHEIYDRIVAALPAQAAISAPVRIQPHLAQRTQAYMFPNPFEWSAFYNVQGFPLPVNVDYILFDTRRVEGFYALPREKLKLLTDLRGRGLYRTLIDFDGVLLLQRSDATLDQHCFGPDWKAPRCLAK